MKYLQDYMNESQSQLLDECGAFFAFSNKQFDEQKQNGITYISMGAGLLCNEEHVTKLITGMDEILNRAVRQDLAENGQNAIIERELYNYECIYTGDISPCVDALSVYDIPLDDIKAVFLQEVRKGEDYR